MKTAKFFPTKPGSTILECYGDFSLNPATLEDMIFQAKKAGYTHFTVTASYESVTGIWLLGDTSRAIAVDASQRPPVKKHIERSNPNAVFSPLTPREATQNYKFKKTR